ncbi:MAG: hypothetical protein JNK15_03850 [Planctomycetes bacterium]|nr:hypothetical protein [Planctomycetota bacterium]
MRPWISFVPFLFVPLALAQAPATVPANKLPVREVTVFKDGHAYLVREAPLPATATTFVLDELPTPVLGTFWPYATGGASLLAAKAGRDLVASDVAAMDFRQIARVNVGKDVVVLLHDKERVEGRLLGVPSRQDQPAASDGELLLVQTASGTRVVALNQVRDLEVRGEFTAKIRIEETKERLTLTVAGAATAPGSA